MATKDLKQAAVSEDVYEQAAHHLPPAINFIINNLLLLLLLIAEGYLMGSLFSRGWVDNIEAPNHWGTYHGVGVILFYAAGAATAGLGLRASVAAAAAIRGKKWGFGVFNLFTLLVLSASEIWSSLSERSFHLVASPADHALLASMGQPPDAAISPTLLVVSFVLPFASLSYGFSQQRKARVSSADLQDEEMEMDRKILHAEKQARLNAARAKGVAQTGRAFWRGAQPDQTDAGPEASVAAADPQ
ncbi:MAG: hypothetical protein H0U76_10020 [Ktedonobacteraceae bacterium]|nr:hypothetical protein [Ktedonobacteraceae bacterium]